MRRYRPLRRSRLVVLPINLASSAVPSLLAAIVFDRLAGGTMEGNAGDVALLGVLAAALLAANFVLLTSLMALLDGGRLREALRPHKELMPSIVLTVALALAIAAACASAGPAAGAFVILIIIAFS